MKARAENRRRVEPRVRVEHSTRLLRSATRRTRRVRAASRVGSRCGALLVFAAGRREQHSGRVLHPAEGRAPIAVHASPTTRHPERSSRRAQAGGNGVEGPLTIRGRRRRVGEMANDECGMTKEARMTTSPSRGASFGLRISSFLRHSSSVIRHFPASPRRELEVLRLRSAPLRMTGFFDTRLRALHRSRGKRRTAIRAGAFAPASGSFPATIQSPNPTRP